MDANKNVYVYSPSGTLLGSWSAGGLSSSAQLTGIATNGTDIWLVDSYSDKVYKFTGAASRLSGSQNPSSSFNLVSHRNGSTNPQDIVTDGTSFWVVDGSQLKVFKYTLSGSLLGSWSIDPADTHPTGVTINPNNVSDIWIVDNGTDKVYQYIGAASRTSGSQSAAATFALAAGSANPQGIADPPTADMLLAPNPPTAAGIPSLTSRDAAFVSLAQEPLRRASELLSSGAVTPLLDSLAPFAHLAWTTAGAFGGVNPLAPLTLLAPMSGQGNRSDSSAMKLQDGTLAGGDTEASVAAMDLASAGLANESAAEE